MGRRWQSTCTECGWVSKATKTRPVAEYAYTRHSCDKQRRRQEATARLVARMAAVDRTPQPCLHKQATHQHGTHACYVLDRCRCWPCTRANAAYANERARLHAYGRWNGYVDADPTREHVKALMAAGMGLKRIVAVSGVPQGTLWKLVYGKRGPDGRQRPSQRITPETERRLLATQLNLADGAKVDQTGTTRRIQAMVALGWSQSRIAAELGINRANFTAIALGRRQVTAATERAVRDLYDRWSMTFPPADTQREKISVNRARRYAKARGWLPPLAWDDERLDDPDYRPAVTVGDDGVDEVAVRLAMSGHRVRLTSTERAEAVRRLTVAGHSASEIAALLNITPRTVTRRRVETGRAAA